MEANTQKKQQKFYLIGKKKCKDPLSEALQIHTFKLCRAKPTKQVTLAVFFRLIINR
jgi:hypothetical protein